MAQWDTYLASTQNRITWSFDAAERQLESQGVMPEDFEGCIAYPAVNPKGCYTKEQMGYVDRL